MAHKIISDAQRDYRWYRGVFDDHGGFPREDPGEVIDDPYDIFGQMAIWETDGGSSFSTHDLSVIAAALQRLSKIISTSGVAFADQIRNLVDDVESSQVLSFNPS